MVIRGEVKQRAIVPRAQHNAGCVGRLAGAREKALDDIKFS